MNIIRMPLSFLADEYQTVEVIIKTPVINKNLFRIVNLSTMSIIHFERIKRI